MARIRRPADLDQLQPLIAAGDAQAFAAWLAGAERRVRDSLRSYATRVDTEAMTQEALMRIWQGAGQFKPDGQPNGLLRLAITIAQNLARSEMRRNRVDFVEVEDLERAARALDDGAFAVVVADPRLRAIIQGCLGELPPKPAAALAARIANDGADPDHLLAERLGMKINTFLQNLTRARKLMAECLRRHRVDLEEEMP
jgi:DNA-directed RNA polymerase specialized sigma24 family protein